jgi:hypothetical protein
MDERGELTRREVLRLGAMAGGAVLAAALVGCEGGGDDEATSASSTPDRAAREEKTAEATPPQLLAGAPPVVDRLAVWSLVDNAHDIFLKSGPVGDIAVKCEVQRNGLGVGPNLSTQQRQSGVGRGVLRASPPGGDTRSCLVALGLSMRAGVA